MSNNHDINLLRSLAELLKEIINKPIQEKRRDLWSQLNSFELDRPLIYVRAFAFDEIFNPMDAKCSDPDYRQLELRLRMLLFRDTIGDDFIIEPWIIQNAVFTNPFGDCWGLSTNMTREGNDIKCAGFKPSLINEIDFSKMRLPCISVDEEKTAGLNDKLNSAIGDIIPVFINRKHYLASPNSGDISADLAKMRGMQELMLDAYDRPKWLHKVLAFMQGALLEIQSKTEASGDYNLATQDNQAMPYCRELNRPAISKSVKRNETWAFMAAQEFTGYSPEFFEEFMFNYQIPLLENFGMVSYGCCEDMTNNISIIKKLKNLRRIAITPYSDVKKCAEQIGGDYILSWRPNPSLMIATGLDEGAVRQHLRENFKILKQNHCRFDITLKDVETINRQPENVSKWVKIAREEIVNIF